MGQQESDDTVRSQPEPTDTNDSVALVAGLVEQVRQLSALVEQQHEGMSDLRAEVTTLRAASAASTSRGKTDLRAIGMTRGTTTSRRRLLQWGGCGGRDGCDGCQRAARCTGCAGQ